ncbi:hypothetical protein EST62_00510 [Chlorobaculum sp. 24CR]|uniref:hypothetical protein n=1 Tax=Chlorobaculum sp. 24CR TaxID=2508878 RepID=UPI00100AD291|nr:hypothetical protein [Chlorobaculum sp. 24CR]RXK89058.1 hypothetical protein EST62_00510 [Chlorobaculum sp. 24CR]
MASIEQRVKALEGGAAVRASQQADKPTIDYTKLSDEALEELRAAFNEFGECDYRKLSTETLEEIVAARIAQ